MALELVDLGPAGRSLSRSKAQAMGFSSSVLSPTRPPRPPRALNWLFR